MKRIFYFISVAAFALLAVACNKKDNGGDIDWGGVTVDGFYVAGPATGSDKIQASCVMAAGFNEVDKALREGMYEKYIVLEGGKEFYLIFNDGGTKTRYSATLSKVAIDTAEEGYADNPSEVIKGALVIGNDAPAMKVEKTGLYHIVLDRNVNGDLDDAGGAQILVLDASDFGLRGGMNGWGFTSSDPKVTSFSNDGVTFTFKDQELGAGGEYKFATGNYWKVTLDTKGKVKAEVSLAQGMTVNGANFKVEKAGLYDITLSFKLAAGSFDKSFSYTEKLTKEYTAPTTMYMNGGQWGGDAWDWSASTIVELVPVWGATGYFWCTRWFDSSKGFKFCAKREWNGDFTGDGTHGYSVADGNCFVAADGFYTVLVNGNNNSVEIAPAEVYGIGDAWGTDAWDYNDNAVKFVADGQVLKATVVNDSEALRIASKVTPSAAIEGVTTGSGWIDWWKTEFIFFDGVITYRGAGDDQARVSATAGQTVTLDFNNGTATMNR